MEDTKKIAQKIKNLLAKAASASELGSLHEAEIFANKAQELMVKYNLSIEELPDNEKKVGKETFSPVQAKNQGTWVLHLYNTVSKFNYCTLIMAGSNKILHIVGEEHNRLIVHDLVAALKPRIIQIEKDNWSQYEGSDKRATYRRSFLRGCVEGIKENMQLKMDRMEQEMTGVTEMGLAKRDKLKDFTDSNFNLKSKSATRTSGNGAGAGRAAGKSMSINRGVGATNNQKTLN